MSSFHFRMQSDLLRRGRQDVPADDPEAAGGQTALRVQPKLGGQPVRDGRLRSGMPASVNKEIFHQGYLHLLVLRV